MKSLADKKTECTASHSFSFIYNFFCWCSGARLYILKQCPSEFNKYYGIGVIVFLTGLMAALSGGYAFFTVFKSYAFSIGFGIFWGFVIFSIDWYIVSSLRKQQKTIKELGMAFPRFVLAILIAFVVSMPLKLKLFEKEIEQQILFDQQQSVLNYQESLSKEFVDISKLEQENIRLRDEINEKQAQRTKLFAMIVEEAEGLSPTGIVGKGPVYREKKNEYDKIDEELIQLRKNNLSQIEKNSIALDKLKESMSQSLSSAKVVNTNSDGFLARLQAMSALNEKNLSIKLASWFIILLFITIECAPILVKLMSARGPYDDLHEAEEYIKQVEIRKILVKAELTEDNQIDMHRLLEKERNSILFEVEKSNIQNEASVLEEINALKISRWKDDEIRKINESFAPSINSNIIKEEELIDEDKVSGILEPEDSPNTKDTPIIDDEVPDSKTDDIVDNSIEEFQIG